MRNAPLTKKGKNQFILNLHHEFYSLSLIKRALQGEGVVFQIQKRGTYFLLEIKASKNVVLELLNYLLYLKRTS